jgi:hypothetical protein
MRRANEGSGPGVLSTRPVDTCNRSIDYNSIVEELRCQINRSTAACPAETVHGG